MEVKHLNTALLYPHRRQRHTKQKCLERSASLISFAYSNISQKIISCEFKSQTKCRCQQIVVGGRPDRSVLRAPCKLQTPKNSLNKGKPLTGSIASSTVNDLVFTANFVAIFCNSFFIKFFVYFALDALAVKC